MEMAVKYYKKAAEKQNINAIYRLAICYEEGYGVKQDLHLADHYYT